MFKCYILLNDKHSETCLFDPWCIRNCTAYFSLTTNWQCWYKNLKKNVAARIALYFEIYLKQNDIHIRILLVVFFNHWNSGSLS